jgi:CheY-like chemotaxis protein
MAERTGWRFPQFSTVLIIDDDERAREALKALLIGDGYRLEFAHDGASGLQLALDTQPDLILLDVMMPGMDGYEVCQRLRDNPAIAEVPVLMVTALDHQEACLRGLQAGADDFIAKPYNRLELRARIATIMRLNRYRRLLAERSKFSWLVENSEEAYLLLEEDGTCSYANSKAKNYLCINGNGEDFLECAQQRYQLTPPHAWENWPQSLPGNIPRRLVRPESPDSPALWLEVESVCVNPNQPDGVLLRLRDITQKMRLDQQTWSFQTLISHKLRTPMAAVEILQLLKNRLQDCVDSHTLALLDLARENASRQNEQILKLLRLMEMPLLTQQAQGNGFYLQELPVLVEQISKDMGVEFEVVLPPELQSKTLALSVRGIESILRALLDNAKKFHPRGKPRIQILAQPGKADACDITVMDDGRHLPPEELEKIWLPYYQVEKYFTGEVLGMGLGMYMIASLIWSVGGQCRAENRPSQPGLMVILSLPYRTPAVSQADGALVQAAGSDKLLEWKLGDLATE